MREKIKDAVLRLLKDNTNYTFSELISDLENFGLLVRGDRSLYLKENLIIWENTTSDFNNAILELNSEDKIEMKRLSGSEAYLVYSYGGEVIDLPIADMIENYTTPHWCPTIVERGKNFSL